MDEERISKIVKDQPDSFEIGTPSKGGCIKCYGDFNDLDSFKKKLDNAFSLKSYAISQT